MDAVGRFFLVLVAVLALVVAGGLLTESRGRLARQTAGEDVAYADPSGDEAYVWGRRFFDDACRYVADDADAPETLSSFHFEMEGVFELEATVAARIRTWYGGDRGFRIERVDGEQTTTWILRGGRGWRRRPGERFAEVTGPGLEALSTYASSLHEVASLIALAPLRGASARFRFEGYKTGSGWYAGRWVKVVRLEPDAPDVVFWLAFEPAGEEGVRATWPGIVRTADDGAEGDWILREWDAPLSPTGAGPRFPRRIERYHLERDARGDLVPQRTLVATLAAWEPNPAIPDETFTPEE